MNILKFKNTFFNLFKINSWLFVLIILSLLPLLDLLKQGLPVTHDGWDHVARIANFYRSLSEGNIVPRWAGNLNWGYGHPILMFLYPLPSYAASLFHFLTFSYIDSVKIVFGLAYVSSAIAMFIWLKAFLGTRSGFIGALFYIYAPYRFVDLYVRGAIGEHVAFIFLPLSLYFILKLSIKYSIRYLIGGSLAVSALILSHNALTLMFLPIILSYVIFLVINNKNRKVLLYRYLVIFLIGVGLSFFFLIPAFFEGRYTLRDIVTAGEYSARFVSIQNLLYGPWNYGITGQFTVQLGILHWLGLLISVLLFIFLRKKFTKSWLFYLFILIYFIVSMFLMLKSSLIVWDTLSILQKFQFPWRFLSVSVFCTAVFGAYVVSILNNKIKTSLIVFVVLMTIFINKDYFHAKGFVYNSDNYFNGIYNGTTDTGESSPIWSVRFMENAPATKIEFIQGSGNLQEIYRSSTSHLYQINSKTVKSRIRENTLYFPGWKVLVDNQDTSIEFQDPKNRGVITFYVDRGTHFIKVIFTDTKLRVYSNLISITSLIILVTIMLISRFF